ncbi:hypothetical protein [Nocardioides coralli]|uniref:hypothetical protein n=1 Tax=Nocardioides coralli TaxID=2872154 RepID=UPI001CA38F1A|nr:hypothetical protein [Nocardioides coralli]QZY28871.1 hypothetical protein K6T13_15705 [Nocardioides coralli]
MAQHDGPTGGRTPVRRMFDPTTRALAGLVLAVSGLLGANGFTTGLQFLSEVQFGGAPSTFMFWRAVATAVPLALGLWLALEPARSPDHGWVTSVARAALVAAALGLTGSLLLLAGVFLT